MENYADILTKQIGPNTVQDLLIALVTFFVAYIALTVLWKFLLKRVRTIASRTTLKADDVIIDVLEGVGSLFYIAIALYISVQSLSLAPVINIVVKGIFLIAVTYEVIKLAEHVIHFFVARGMKARKGGATAEEEAKVSSIFSIFIKFALWSIGLLLILSNLGFNITSLVAGLGIGGLAISLALQSILTDVFSSLSIAVDKPFQEGDFIVVGSDKGTVKHIGIKTTRLQSLQGEEIVISNTELTTARVQNFRKLQKRRVV
ncbi:MAG: mechanosensitive ion channel domain-containing protein, partial [Patescibacteria group bacterium]